MNVDHRKYSWLSKIFFGLAATISVIPALALAQVSDEEHALKNALDAYHTQALACIERNEFNGPVVTRDLVGALGTTHSDTTARATISSIALLAGLQHREACLRSNAMELAAARAAAIRPWKHNPGGWPLPTPETYVNGKHSRRRFLFERAEHALDDYRNTLDQIEALQARTSGKAHMEARALSGERFDKPFDFLKTAVCVAVPERAHECE